MRISQGELQRICFKKRDHTLPVKGEINIPQFSIRPKNFSEMSLINILRELLDHNLP